MKITTDCLGMKTVIWEPGDPAHAAGAELAEAITSRPAWEQKASYSPDAQRHTNGDQYGFDEDPWATVYWDCVGVDGKQWSGCIWNGGDRAWKSGWHETAADVMDEADSVLDSLARTEEGR